MTTPGWYAKGDSIDDVTLVDGDIQFYSHGTPVGDPLALSGGATAALEVVTYAGSLSAARPAAAAAVYWVDFPATPTNAESQDIIAAHLNPSTAVTTTGGTTTLTATSTVTQILTGTLYQNVQLPSSGVVAGQRFLIVCESTAGVDVSPSTGGAMINVSDNQSAQLVALINTPTTAAHWALHILAEFPPKHDPYPWTLAVRDGNTNIVAHNFVATPTSTATAAGTTTLTVDSTQVQVFTGTTTQTVTLPTTSVPVGMTFTIVNNSTGAVTINASAGALVATVAAARNLVVLANTATPTTAAHWSVTSASTVTATVNAQTGTTYTLVAADDGKVVTTSNASAVTVTVPQNSDQAIPVGSYIEVVQLGAGQITFAAGTGATVRSRGTALKISGQYGTAALRKIGTNEFVLAGDLTT